MPDQFDPDFPTRYRKLPVTVEAIRYTPGTNCAAVARFLDDDPDDLTCAEEADHQEATYAIATLEGVMHASPGDYIIRGAHGEYPCKPDIFEATYERADTPVIPGQNPGKPTAETVADALIRYETGGICHYGQTCGLCDCGRADETPEQTQTRDAMELDRARAVLAVLPAALPSDDEAARAIARASDVEWDYNPEDPEDPYRHDARAVLALIPPQRCVPSEDEVKTAVLEHFRHTEYGWRLSALDAARAILALFGDQHTVTQAKAEALRETAVEFDREAAEDRARHRVADVRCIRCGLRYDECQEYSCQTEGTAHDYDEVELAEAAQLDGETSWIGDRLRARAAAIEERS